MGKPLFEHQSSKWDSLTLSPDLLSTSEKIRDDELESTGEARGKGASAREGFGKLEVNCMQPERARTLGTGEAAYTAQLNSRMCPDTVLGNSSITRELGRWQNWAGYLVQNKPPPFSSELCSLQVFLSQGLFKSQHFVEPNSVGFGLKRSVLNTVTALCWQSLGSNVREISAAISERWKRWLWGFFSRDLGTWTPQKKPQPSSLCTKTWLCCTLNTSTKPIQEEIPNA